MSEESSAEWTEGMTKGAGCEGEESHGEGGWKRSKPPSPDGERRENEDGDPCSMTSIVVVVVVVVIEIRK